MNVNVTETLLRLNVVVQHTFAALMLSYDVPIPVVTKMMRLPILRRCKYMPKF